MSARDDYPILADCANGRNGVHVALEAERALDQIDMLRALVDGLTAARDTARQDTTEPIGYRKIAVLLADALRKHRVDMHNTSSRPCATCKQSARALATYDQYIAAHSVALAGRGVPAQDATA